MKYLSRVETENPEAIEVLFCKPLDELGKRQPMNEQQMKIVYLCLTLPEEEMTSLYNEIKKHHVILSIMEDRLKALNCPHDMGSLAIIALVCDTPGEAVMYSNYLAYKAKDLNLDEITVKDLCDKIIPFGAFTKDTLNEYWDKQKVEIDGSVRGSDNLLDYIGAAVSITK